MNKKKLFEYSAPECKVLEEQVDDVTKDRIMRVEVKWQHADRLNGNGRIYPRSILEREINRFKPLIKEGKATGCSFHPVGEGKIDDITHLWEDVWMEPDGSCMGTIKILPTDKGRNAQVLIRNGGHIGLSSRGVGTVSTRRMAVDGVEEKIVEVVNDDYILESPGDFVLTPSVPDAGIRKVLESKFSNDNVLVEGEENMERKDEEINQLNQKINELMNTIELKDKNIVEMRELLKMAEKALSEVVEDSDVDVKDELDRSVETISEIVRILKENGYIESVTLPATEESDDKELMKQASEKIESLQRELNENKAKLEAIEEQKRKLELSEYISQITSKEKFGNILSKKLLDKGLTSKEQIDEEFKTLKGVISAALDEDIVNIGKGTGKRVVEGDKNKDSDLIRERLKALANIKK